MIFLGSMLICGTGPLFFAVAAERGK